MGVTHRNLLNSCTYHTIFTPKCQVDSRIVLCVITRFSRRFHTSFHPRDTRAIPPRCGIFGYFFFVISRCKFHLLFLRVFQHKNAVFVYYFGKFFAKNIMYPQMVKSTYHYRHRSIASATITQCANVVHPAQISTLFFYVCTFCTKFSKNAPLSPKIFHFADIFKDLRHYL